MLNDKQQGLVEKNLAYHYLTSPTEDTLIKALFDDYTSNPIELEKKGSEIKEKLVLLINAYTTKKQLAYESLVEKKRDCPGEPIEKPDRYLIQGFETKLSPLPKMYSWEQCDSVGSYKYEVQSSNPFTDVNAATGCQPKLTAEECCRCYNECVREYIYCCIELCKMQTLHDNVPATMKLSLRQASILGF